MRFPGVPTTNSSILLTIRIHQIRWRVTGLTTLDAFIAIPRRRSVSVLISSSLIRQAVYYYYYTIRSYSGPLSNQEALARAPGGVEGDVAY
jgi:hypothetical protein